MKRSEARFQGFVILDRGEVIAFVQFRARLEVQALGAPVRRRVDLVFGAAGKQARQGQQNQAAISDKTRHRREIEEVDRLPCNRSRSITSP